MKKVLGTLLALVLTVCVHAQLTLRGTVTNQATNQPVAAATVSIYSGQTLVTSTATGNQGQYELKVPGPGSYQVVADHIGLQQERKPVTLTQPVTEVTFTLGNAVYFLEPLEVKAVRAGDKAPFTRVNLAKEDIEKQNLGQDLPILLGQTPNAVVSSDAGNGVGYTGIRIRGSDGSRINVTMNGIPYNDAESQGTYFVDLPDFASSLSSVQIQRGVGTSSNGAGAFGATINLSTNEFNQKAYTEFNNSYGSFNTWKNTVKVGSGLLGEHFTVDARLSQITSDGYIDRATSNLRSFFLSTAWTTATTSLRFNVLSGKEKTYQAWYGVPQSMLRSNRTFNSAGTEKPGAPYDNETDNYQQDHYQLFYNQSFTSRLSFNTALYLTRGKGYYEQYKASQRFSSYGLANPVVGGTAVTRTDLTRRLWLDNYFYGQIYSLHYKTAKDQLTVGGGWSRYDGKHYGDVIWAFTGFPNNFRYYNLDAFKTDVNMYAKWQHSISNHLETFADVQFRSVRHQMNGFRKNPTVLVDRKFNFVNPKVGLTYTNNSWQAYASYAVGNKEPNRDDFEAGVTQQPTHERLHNIEAGVERRTSRYSYGANVYYMKYKNQLVLTGKVNDVGAYARQNIPNSYRLGLELQGAAVITQWLNLSGNLAFSRNKIKRFTEYIDDYDAGKQNEVVHRNTDISFSPAVVGAGTINVLPVKNGTISLLSKYVGRQYLDNTQNTARSLTPYYVQDVRFTYVIKNKLFKEWQLIAQVNNVFNKLYEPNGYTFSYVSGGSLATENYYYPMAGTNAMFAVNIRL